MSAAPSLQRPSNRQGHPLVLTNSVFRGSNHWLDHSRSIYRIEENGPEPARWNPLRESAALARSAGKFDVVLTQGGRTALLYGVFCLLTRRPARQIMAELLMDEPRPRHPLWRCKQWLYRRIAKRTLGVISGSTEEADALAVRLDIDSTAIRVVPAHPTVAPRHSPDNQGYVLAAGRSFRDYDSLILAAQNIRAPVRIVCGRNDLVNVEFPDNVSVRREVSREEYLSLLAHSRVVVVPLQPVCRVTGQVALLDAMALGKPVVVSLVAGTTDIVRSDWNAIGVSPCDAKPLSNAVNRLLHDDALAATIGANAYEDVMRAYSDDHYADRMLEAIQELWDRSVASDR